MAAREIDRRHNLAEQHRKGSNKQQHATTLAGSQPQRVPTEDHTATVRLRLLARTRDEHDSSSGKEQHNDVANCGCYFIGTAHDMVEQCPGVDFETLQVSGDEHHDAKSGDHHGAKSESGAVQGAKSGKKNVDVVFTARYQRSMSYVFSFTFIK